MKELTFTVQVHGTSGSPTEISLVMKSQIRQAIEEGKK